MIAWLIYFTLLAFWLEKSLQIGNLAEGFSLKNLSLYFFILVFGLTAKSRDSLFQKNNVNKYIFFLMVIIAVSIIPNLYGDGAQKTSLYKEIVSYKNFVTPWLFFLLITTLINDKKTCERAISALALFLLMTVVLVFMQNYLGIDVGTQKAKIGSLGRSAGFSEPNQYAAFLVLFLPLFLSSALFHEQLPRKIKASFFLLLAITALIFTVSKGGFIAFCLSTGAFFYVAHKTKLIVMKTIILLVFLLLIFSTSSYFLLPSQTKKLAKERVTLQNSGPYNPYASEKSLLDRITTGRTEVWMYSLKLIAQKPIFGWGNAAGKNQLGLSTHSDPLKWLVNYGIIGFLLFIMLYIQIYKHVRSQLWKVQNTQSKILYLGYFSGFVGYVIAMSGVNLNEPRYIFWIYTAIVYKHIQLDAVEREEPI